MAGRILVVDDVAANRIILKAKLALACYDVIQAESGPQALRLARSAAPDLILLDLAMPGMSGQQVLAELKRAPDTASIPVVVVTSFADMRSKLDALRAGAEDFLTKPVDDTVLAARVRAILRTRMLAEELELREDTRRALGFAEAPTGFDTQAVASTGAGVDMGASMGMGTGAGMGTGTSMGTGMGTGGPAGAGTGGHGGAPRKTSPGAYRGASRGSRRASAAGARAADGGLLRPGDPEARHALGHPGSAPAPALPAGPAHTGAHRVASPGAVPGAPPARIALIGPDAATALGWRGALAGHLPHRLDVMGRAEALHLARAASSPAGPTDPGRRGAPEALPDLFVIAADLAGSGDGLMLISELRAMPSTRHAAILVVLKPEQRRAAAMALDLGASDLMALPLHPEEMALRIATQLRRKSAAEAMRRRLREGLQLAVTDVLTGLPNRRYALSHLERVRERAARRGSAFAVLMLDLDRFKAVNDGHGHAAGDAVLRGVAARLYDRLRAVDLLARIGGEEFLAVLPDLGRSEARAAAERLRAAVADAPFPLPPAPGLAAAPAGAGRAPGALRQTVSIGVVCAAPRPEEAAAPSQGPAVAALLQRADAALYRAKAQGRDMVAEAPPANADEAAA